AVLPAISDSSESLARSVGEYFVLVAQYRARVDGIRHAVSTRRAAALLRGEQRLFRGTNARLHRLPGQYGPRVDASARRSRLHHRRRAAVSLDMLVGRPPSRGQGHRSPQRGRAVSRIRRYGGEMSIAISTALTAAYALFLIVVAYGVELLARRATDSEAGR